MVRPHLSARAAGLLLGYAADRVFGDPQRHHPVAWFGTWAGFLEQRLWADQRARGIAFGVAAVGPPLIVTTATTGRGWIRRMSATAVVTWAALGGSSLEREALAVHALLVADDLDGARDRIRSLVGRDVSQAGPDDLARAVVESLAENQSDAVAATLLWGALLGAPGVVLHRCSNTLDAMVGHRTERYANFGWAAARFDDVLNWLPSRVSVLATAAVSGSLAQAREVWRTVRRDAGQHPSPNAGPVEAATAAALGVRLGGLNVYASGAENRGVLGNGLAVTVADIPRAVLLERRVGRVVLALCVASCVTGISSSSPASAAPRRSWPLRAVPRVRAVGPR